MTVPNTNAEGICHFAQLQCELTMLTKAKVQDRRTGDRADQVGLISQLKYIGHVFVVLHVMIYKVLRVAVVSARTCRHVICAVALIA